MSTVAKIYYSKEKENMVWETPQALFDLMDQKHGPFDIDLAASDHNAKCSTYLSQSDNALDWPWAPLRCWVNPPYQNLKLWSRKILTEAQNGATIVALLPACTSAIWFHDYLFNKAQIIYFVKGRLKFNNSRHTAIFSNMVVVFDPKIKTRKTQYKHLDIRKVKS